MTRVGDRVYWLGRTWLITGHDADREYWTIVDESKRNGEPGSSFYVHAAALANVIRQGGGR